MRAPEPAVIDFGGDGTLDLLGELPHANALHDQRLIRSPSPQWSIKTLRSADNIPPALGSAVTMDAEDSPWGDEPSRSSPNAPSTNADENSKSMLKDEAVRAASEISADRNNIANDPKSVPSPINAEITPRSPRGPRTPQRPGARTTKLEALDDSLGPLGPLGANDAEPSEPEQPPLPPLKEQSLPVRNAHNAPSPLSKSFAGSGDLGEDGRARGKSSGQPSLAGSESQGRQTQPSVSIEQAARPTFDITVGDPHKVGDITSSHIVYQVSTKTTSKAYKSPNFTVSRRYRDFLWLYNSMHSTNPGIIIPPPPEKQAMNRFDSNFVESRRAALERMLNKIAAHPVLQHDADLKIFLESEAFNVDVKHREHKEPALGESKGMLSAIGIGGGSGSSGGKFLEHDDWFHDRKIYLDALETQLKSLQKALDTVVSQRKQLADAAGEFSASLSSLSTVELSVSLSAPLASLSDLQLRIRDLYDRQAQTDVLTLGITIDEYIRLISSIRQSFSQRQKSYHSWHSAESELLKRRTQQDKTLRSGKTQQDRLDMLRAEVSEAEKEAHRRRVVFEDMGRVMRGELERWETEKVEDFRGGVETFLEGCVEAQKELIELWETFLLQFDADEDGEPFFKPPATAVTGPTAQQHQQQGVGSVAQRPSQQHQEEAAAPSAAQQSQQQPTARPGQGQGQGQALGESVDTLESGGGGGGGGEELRGEAEAETLKTTAKAEEGEEEEE